MTQLTTHFSLEELTASLTADIHHIDNTPPANVVEHLYTLAEGLELVRTLLADPMHINSGYRCEVLDRLVGGVTNSAHQTGYAADFICPLQGAPIYLVHRIQRSNIKFDQLIQEGTWVHISFDPAMRQEVYTAHFYNGKAVYTKE